MSRFISLVAERVAVATDAFATRTKPLQVVETSARRSKRHVAILLTAGVLSSLAFTASAKPLALAQIGPCGVAVLDGRHVQPSTECRLPPPAAQNPTSIGNTSLTVRDELEVMADQLFGETERFTTHPDTPSLADRTSAHPIAAHSPAATSLGLPTR
jgi:hypothetical protein